MTTTINHRTYEVKPIETGERTRTDLLSRGWDGQVYALRGKRGAVKMAYRSKRTGEFRIV